LAADALSATAFGVGLLASRTLLGRDTDALDGLAGLELEFGAADIGSPLTGRRVRGERAFRARSALSWTTTIPTTTTTIRGRTFRRGLKVSQGKLFFFYECSI